MSTTVAIQEEKVNCNAQCHSPDPGPNCSCSSGATVPLYTDPRDALRVVRDHFPWQKVRRHLALQEGMPSAHISPAVKACQEFLAIVLLAEGPIAMVSKIADAAWHSAILHTSGYEELRRAVVLETGEENFFFHHVPGCHEPVSAEMVLRFNEMLNLHFPRSRAWATCRNIDASLN